MNNTRELSKLVELRAKTDRQLMEYISNRLDVGITFARLVNDQDTRERWASTEMFESRAREAFEEAHRLLPVVSKLHGVDRRPLVTKLQQLGELLSKSAAGQSCLRAAC